MNRQQIFNHPTNPSRTAIVIEYDCHGTSFTVSHLHEQSDGQNRRLSESELNAADRDFLSQCERLFKLEHPA